MIGSDKWRGFSKSPTPIHTGFLYLLKDSGRKFSPALPILVQHLMGGKLLSRVTFIAYCQHLGFSRQQKDHKSQETGT